MIDIKGTTITITKGDTALITVQAFNPDGSAYEPEEGDRIRFAMKRNFYDAEPLLVKDIPIDTMELRLDAEDTKNLEAGPANGRYKYDIELSKADGTIDTFIPRATLIVLEEVM